MKNDTHCWSGRFLWIGICFLLVLSCGCDSPSAGTPNQITRPALRDTSPPVTPQKKTSKLTKTEAVSFYADVSPILNEYCVRCHGVEEQEAQLELTTLSSVLSGGDSGPAVEPGKPGSSLLWEMVSEKTMPPKGPRPNRAERELIRRWIAGGAQD